MKRMMVGTALIIGLAACGEWKTYVLRDPVSGRQAACATPWGGALPPEWIQPLHQCIAACEARGYRLLAPGDVPPPVPVVQNAKPPSIPPQCE
jgi:hypothetical protein